ncbi:peptide chain release factor 2 [Mycoplasma sp. P36-A1]|uniref:peptide chain release factor 2 n=1 Tax=Mycoplasma sp. P36-A1 TaxID=3252900 RepID=UPI003C2B03DB
MESYEIKQILKHINQQLKLLVDDVYLDDLNKKVTEIEEQMIDPNFYSDQKHVASTTATLSANKDILSRHHNIKNLISDIEDYLKMYNEDEDIDILNELNINILQLQKQYEKFEILLLLDEEYDKNDALVEIYVGAGGTESQDWVDMLYKMYLAYAKDKGFKIEIVSANYAIDVGIKSITLKVKGIYAYGLLKNEKGVHRLIRISPFDHGDRRHTTFAMVSIAPILEDVDTVEINENDLVIDTYKSSGAGGQSVNTTDSAVRISHKPTNIVVTSQNQRSQLQNKQEALQVLKAKLVEKQLEEKKKQLQLLKGESQDVNFGSQIRTYVFHPYSMIKDHRSNYESSNPGDVLSGKLDEVINSVLRASKGRWYND